MLFLSRFSAGKAAKSGKPLLWNMAVASRNKENVKNTRKEIKENIDKCKYEINNKRALLQLEPGEQQGNQV